ncbi:hypothetical protein GCM10008995_02000 [Halobellus salinus]|uniref:Uncharacterized protein n=1 Tax=Halobellus salinus TaxID=931585 RepID=A0A830E723_9EURY|nr:hypothetical protein [Halobellus salinus]GGI95488.1 hypothetical protein GCM10008995_02000 [Halobellus salinus]
MTRLQQVLFELKAPYMGHAYYVPGHALYNALARRVDDATRQALHVSHGVFLPGEWAEYPDTHPDEGSLGKLSGSLPEVESYADWFLLRNPTHPWLLDSRPRDAHNTQDLQEFGGRVAAASETRFARPPETRNRQRSVQWYVHCYVHADHPDVLPLDTDTLDGIQVGAARNYGFGELTVADTNVVALDDLSFDRLQDAAEGEDPCRVELVTPYVTESKFPGAEPQSVPWWWNVSEFDAAPGNYAQATGMRSRVTRLAHGGEAYSVRVLDHGQRVGFAGDAERVVETARNGICRIGTHSRFGFGELRVRPPEAVPQYARRDDESRAAREAEPVASDTAREAQEAEDADGDRDADEPRRRVLVGAGGVDERGDGS